MRVVRYGGAMSLDGYIAGPSGDYDWIVHDPEMDFAEMMARFDTFLIGRKTFEMMVRAGQAKTSPPGIEYVIVSSTIRSEDYPQFRLSRNGAETLRELRMRPGKDIAIFGGGELFRSLLAAGLVDRIEVAVVPILLGGGVPVLPSPADRARLKLLNQRTYSKTGIVRLEYEILPK
ncbi:MAG TPA: dihydrofolate reductase family protein [Terracidiphilus sp.]|nr:dihydrofolate reductase family protein [Terracidiphilus sp.]